ncbi:hypothetical protein BN140_0840 [Methanoculleus bourgensis MS2]|uniref:Uncharacterized protein n=1 Tax=Methanoculleus bourgensis (strain ATCC 43281 / DSM 3045 / OCM 15 / MS2) TaxID=1201294 RepID=I7J7X8_METBM|nr:hypothetical protein BN140_0840 [Methanoculleus bourgensis MS2]
MRLPGGVAPGRRETRRTTTLHAPLPSDPVPRPVPAAASGGMSAPRGRPHPILRMTCPAGIRGPRRHMDNRITQPLNHPGRGLSRNRREIGKRILMSMIPGNKDIPAAVTPTRGIDPGRACIPGGFTDLHHPERDMDGEEGDRRGCSL